MRFRVTLFIVPFLMVALVPHGFAASKDQRKKPVKTVTLISQMRLEYHNKDQGTNAAANRKVDDVFQKTFIVSKKLNENVSAIAGVVFKYNITENESDNLTGLVGVSRNVTNRFKASVTYISSDKYDVLDNYPLSAAGQNTGQKDGDSDILSFGASYQLKVKKPKTGRDALDGGLSYSAEPSMGKAGTLTPKVTYKYDFSKKTTGSVGVSSNFNMASRKNRTSAANVTSNRNSLNTYSVGLKYKFKPKQHLDFQYQYKDATDTGKTDDNVFRFTMTNIF